MSNNGDPRCPSCQGRGGFHGAFGWQRCHCVKATKAKRDAQRALHSIGAKGYQQSLFPPKPGA